MTGSSMTVIVPVPRPNMPRLELGMTQLPLRQVVCVAGLSWPQPGQEELTVLLAPALYGLVGTDDDRRVQVSGPGSQFPDVQGGRQRRRP